MYKSYTIYINLLTFLVHTANFAKLRVWSDLVLGSTKSCGRPKATLKSYITSHPLLCKALLVVLG